jgi:riboflavin synthase
MFCGIVLGIREILEKVEDSGIYRLKIDLTGMTEGLKIGASVSVNGVCLTVVQIQDKVVSFDIIQETISCSNLDSIKNQDWVNIERSLKLHDEIGGHHVSGHVDTTGIIDSVLNSGKNRHLKISFHHKWNRFLVPKGWIALDGISLTIVELGKDWFTVSLIPETLQRTILNSKKKGNLVNLEFDQNNKIIVKTLDAMLPDLENRLRQSMFSKIN